MQADLYVAGSESTASEIHPRRIGELRHIQLWTGHLSAMKFALSGPRTGHRKYNRGHIVNGKWIFGGIERQSGEMFLVPVPQRDAQMLITVIHEWFLPGTTVVSDCWKAYSQLSDDGFMHLTVNHSVNFVDPDTGAHNQIIERVW